MLMMGPTPIGTAVAENGFDALEKYATNLVREAEEGRLDPVVGTSHGQCGAGRWPGLGERPPTSPLAQLDFWPSR